jgi:hypothetical protein
MLNRSGPALVEPVDARDVHQHLERDLVVERFQHLDDALAPHVDPSLSRVDPSPRS